MLRPAHDVITTCIIVLFLLANYDGDPRRPAEVAISISTNAAHHQNEYWVLQYSGKYSTGTARVRHGRGLATARRP